jgi:hypothetical protein
MKWTPSPNFTKGRGNKKPIYLVFHWTGTGTYAGAVAWQTNPKSQVSSHYIISGKEISQLVKEEDTAWTVGKFDINQSSINIEHDATTTKNASDETYETSAQLCAEIIKRYPNIQPKKHKDFTATQCPGTLDVERIMRRANEINKGEDVTNEQAAQMIWKAVTNTDIPPSELAYYKDHIGELSANLYNGNIAPIVNHMAKLEKEKNDFQANDLIQEETISSLKKLKEELDLKIEEVEGLEETNKILDKINNKLSSQLQEKIDITDEEKKEIAIDFIKNYIKNLFKRR